VGCFHRYTLEVTEVEQAGYLIVISFDARGDGSFGPLQRPEKSQLLVDGYVCVDPSLGLKINMPGDDGVAGRFQGTLTFAMDGRCRSSIFELRYGEEGFKPIKIEFDPFQLTKLQKDVSRFLGGYLAKEWDMNGPNKGLRFEKQSARALVADVHQQENLNDCGVYVLENTLRSLRLKRTFLKTMAEASSQVLSSYPWPTQKDITARKLKLKGIVARLFAAAADKGITDVERLLKEDAQLKEEVLQSLTEARDSEVDKFAENLQSELARRTQDKEKETAELKRKEEIVLARREEERLKREEEARRLEEERLERKRGGPPRKAEESRKAKGKEKKRPSGSSEGSASRSPRKSRDKAKGKRPSSESEGSRRSAKSKRARGGGRGRRNRDPSSSRSRSRRRRR